MKKTDFSRHTIADLRDWDNASRLEIQPDFQRNYVWSSPARVMLIDSILRNIPLPKIFIASKIKEGNTHRIVIDGQQRITSILHFLNDKFALTEPYDGKYSKKKFSELPEDVRNLILSYRLDFNEFENYTDQEMREIYNRVNKYTSALTKQELRRADFPGAFLELSEELALNSFFDDAKIFSPASRRRMSDVEYISELLALILAGPQDKKTSLDDFYVKFSKWPKKEADACKKSFLGILDIISSFFPEDQYHIKSTRFNQKSDFYSFFSAVYNFEKERRIIDPTLIPFLIEDLKMIDELVEPNEFNVFGEYAIRCVSDANSKSSREWRQKFLFPFIVGVDKSYNEEKSRVEFLTKILYSLEQGDFECPPREYSCIECHKEEQFTPDKWSFCFPRGQVFLHTGRAVHKKCLNKEGAFLFSDE